MATTTKRVDLHNIYTAVGAIIPEIALTDNKVMTLNGHPCKVFLVQTVTTAETNLNLTTLFAGVRGGVVLNMTDDTTLALAVKPLPSNASIGVIAGTLPADKIYIVVVFGVETR